jgi:propionyl-CoA carboxylase alpha chain
MDVPRFQKGELDTHFIEATFPGGFDGAPLGLARRAIAVAVAAVIAARQQLGRVPEGTRLDWVARVGDDAVGVIAMFGASSVAVTVDGRAHDIAGRWRPGDPLFEGTADGHPVALQVDPLAEGVRLAIDGAQLEVVLRRPRVAELARLMPVKVPPDMSKFLLSPMPGFVMSIAVKPGQTVEPGDALAIVDAMKMENVLTAERQATVKAVRAKAGDILAVDQVILEFE